METAAKCLLKCSGAYMSSWFTEDLPEMKQLDGNYSAASVGHKMSIIRNYRGLFAEPSILH